MKTIIKLLTVLSALLIGTIASGQDDVTLTVFGEGVTKDEATANALRSAIEQAYGVFVSADTKILNDQLVKDEIVTISTGNIKSYKELSQVQTSNGMYNVSLSAVVSIQNLIKYSQSHGSSAEFAGQTFTYNMRMRELNKKNEMAALNNMVEQLRSMQNDIFDYVIEVKEPQFVSDNKYSVPISVAITTNPNYENFIQVISNTLGSLSLTWDEIQNYYSNKMGIRLFMPYYRDIPSLPIDCIESAEPSVFSSDLGFYYLRNDRSSIKSIAEQICEIINNAQRSFYICSKGDSNNDWVPSEHDMNFNFSINNDGRTLASLPGFYRFRFAESGFDIGDVVAFKQNNNQRYQNPKKITIPYSYYDPYRNVNGSSSYNVELRRSVPVYSGEVVATIYHSFEFDLESLNHIQGFEAIKSSIEENAKRSQDIINRENNNLIKPFLLPSESKDYVLVTGFYSRSDHYSRVWSDWSVCKSTVSFYDNSSMIIFNAFKEPIKLLITRRRSWKTEDNGKTQVLELECVNTCNRNKECEVKLRKIEEGGKTYRLIYVNFNGADSLNGNRMDDFRFQLIDRK